MAMSGKIAPIEMPATREGLDVSALGDDDLLALVTGDIQALSSGIFRKIDTVDEQFSPDHRLLQFMEALFELKAEEEMMMARTSNAFTEAERERRMATLKEFSGRLVEKLVTSFDLPWQYVGGPSNG